MKYSSEAGKFYIKCREFVTISRIHACTALPFDENEPIFEEAHSRLKKKILGECENVNISYDFSCKNHSMQIDVTIDKVVSDELTLLIYSPYLKCTRKEAKLQTRGEAFVAGYVFCETHGYTRVTLNALHADESGNIIFSSRETVEKARLEKFFKKCASAVEIYARPEFERRTVRIPSMKAIKFPYDTVRRGQSRFIKETYRCIAKGTTLFATAPTGTGKTVSALYPAIRALGDGRRDKIFYLTPKETTAEAAKECINLMCDSGASIRAVVLGAKEKRCINNHTCKNGRRLCSYTTFNRLPEAVMALYDKNLSVVTAEDIENVARVYTICPYELSLSYAELCDVVICDFNYLFDPKVYIRRFFNVWGNYIFLVDEAHNLPDRAREMYSSEIRVRDIASVADSDLLEENSKLKTASRDASYRVSELLMPYLSGEIHTTPEGKAGAVHQKEIPYELYEVFESLTSLAEKELLRSYTCKDELAEERVKLIREYLYKVDSFYKTMQSFDSSYEMFIFLKDEELSVKLFCIDTGTEISKRLLKGSAAVFFSATLAPLYYYKAVLGNDTSAETLELDSPFDKSQLSVTIMDKISTRFSEREDTLSAVSKAIAAAVSAKRGNYIIFSPSFAYSDALSRAFSAKYPNIKVIVQKQKMTPREKKEFLEQFTKDDKGYLVAFCVMGGIYSEGIDLAGDSLIGAIVVGIGMPALSYEREAISAYYDDKYEEGRQFAYIYPGMNRVLQAAGRVIRRESDRGIIVLIDDRFDDPIYKKTIPSLWQDMKFISDPKSLRAELDKFWNN